MGKEKGGRAGIEEKQMRMIYVFVLCGVGVWEMGYAGKNEDSRKGVVMIIVMT